MTSTAARSRLYEAVLRFGEDFSATVKSQPKIVATIRKADLTLERILLRHLRERLVAAAPKIMRALKQSDVLDRASHPDSARFAEGDTPNQLLAKKLLYQLRVAGQALPGSYTPTQLEKLGFWATKVASAGPGSGSPLTNTEWNQVAGAPITEAALAIASASGGTPGSQGNFEKFVKPYVKNVADSDVKLPEPISQTQVKAEVDAIVAKALGPAGITPELISETIAALDPVAHAGFTSSLQWVGIEAPTSQRYQLVNSQARAWLGAHTNALYQSVDETTKKQVGTALAAGIGKGERLELLGERILSIGSCK